MLPRSLAAMLTATLLLALPGAPAYAANPVTPGTYKGLGFDQCEAPSQSAMSAWIKHSPFKAAGIYISGNSRGCRTQANLTPTWVRNQLSAGWHLMPITLGPQASCSTRYPRYGKNIDPTIIPSTTNGYASARAQGRAEAKKAVSTAQRLGIVAGSTLFYDLEGFAMHIGQACTSSALWFITAWTRQLHTLGYASGFYSSASSGIRMLDDTRVTAGSPHVLPDQIWIADWDGKANTSSTYVRSDGWRPYNRMKQYRGGHTETWGGVKINIDRNYLDLHAVKLGGSGSPAPSPGPTAPKYTGSSTTDARCTPTSISKSSYRITSASRNKALTVPLQCLLKQQHLYKYEVTGTWNSQTRAALNSFQARLGHAKQSYVSRGTWAALLTAGNSHTRLVVRTRAADATRVQRALNAVLDSHLTVSGVYNGATSNAVKAYQRSVGLAVTGNVAGPTWRAFETGRR